MCLLPLIVTFLSTLPFIATTQGREITCSCTTTHCREFGLRVCNTTGLCFSQYLDRRDGTDPLVRGCIESRTPLLCENRRPAVAQHRGWPVLICCDKNMCNAKVMPTVPTSTEKVTTESVTTPDETSDISLMTQSTSTLRDKVYIAVVLVGIFAVISIVILAIFLTRRQVSLFDPEFGRVSTNGYVKGCSEPPSVMVPNKGLENRFALDT